MGALKPILIEAKITGVESVLALQRMSKYITWETAGGLESSDSYRLTSGEFNLQMDSRLGQLMLLVTVKAHCWILKS